MELIHILQIMFDILLYPGRVFALLVNIYKLPPEEAVLVAVMAGTLIILTVEFIDKKTELFSSKWMLLVFAPTATMFLMLYTMESARRVFNASTSYAPGLALIAPLGIPVSLFWLSRAVSWLDAYTFEFTYVINPLSPRRMLKLAKEYKEKGDRFNMEVCLYFIYKYHVLGEKEYKKWSRRLVFAYNIPRFRREIDKEIEREVQEVFGYVYGDIPIVEELLDKKWFRALIWAATVNGTTHLASSSAREVMEKMRKVLGVTPEEEPELMNMYMRFIRERFRKALSEEKQEPVQKAVAPPVDAGKKSKSEEDALEIIKRRVLGEEPETTAPVSPPVGKHSDIDDLVAKTSELMNKLMNIQVEREEQEEETISDPLLFSLDHIGRLDREKVIERALIMGADEEEREQWLKRQREKREEWIREYAEKVAERIRERQAKMKQEKSS